MIEEIMYDIGICGMILSLLGSISSLFYANALGKANVGFHATDSTNALYEELIDNISKSKKRCLWYKLSFYFLTSVSVIGGVIVSTSYFSSVFPNCLSIAGIVILVSSLCTIIQRPEEKLYKTKSDIAFLNKTKYKYDNMSDMRKANTFLAKMLSEFQDRQTT